MRGGWNRFFIHRRWAVQLCVGCKWHYLYLTQLTLVFLSNPRDTIGEFLGVHYYYFVFCSFFAAIGREHTFLIFYFSKFHPTINHRKADHFRGQACVTQRLEQYFVQTEAEECVSTAKISYLKFQLQFPIAFRNCNKVTSVFHSLDSSRARCCYSCEYKQFSVG